MATNTTTTIEPPKRLPDSELATARASKLEKALEAQRTYVHELERGDPGRGLDRHTAERTRAQRLSELEQAGRELARLEAALATNPENRRNQSLFERAARAALRRDAVESADRDFLVQVNAALEQREREAETKAKLREFGERRRNPAHPAARSVTHAVLGSDELWDALRILPREVRLADEDAGVWRDGHVREALIEPGDAGILLVCLKLLEEAAELVVADFGGVPHLHHDRPGELPPLPGLRKGLLRLDGAGMLELKDDGSGGVRVTYGERSIEVARAAGVDVDG